MSMTSEPLGRPLPSPGSVAMLFNGNIDSHSKITKLTVIPNTKWQRVRAVTLHSRQPCVLLSWKTRANYLNVNMTDFKAGFTCCPHVLACGELPKPLVPISQNFGTRALYFGFYCYFLSNFEFSRAWIWSMWKIVFHSYVASGNWGPHNLAVTVMIVIWTTLEIKVIWTTLKHKWTAFHRHQIKSSSWPLSPHSNDLLCQIKQGWIIA